MSSETEVGQKVAKSSPLAVLKVELEKFSESYRSLLPKNYSPDRLITGALVAVAQEPKLLRCTPVSIATALARVAQWGLDVGDTAHLLPFGDSCTPVADYKGLIRLMLRAGARKVEAHEVREGDEFRYEYGTSPNLVHQPTGLPGKKITHVYAIAWLRGGETIFEVMSAEDVDLIRKAKSLQWKGGELPKWYARKTVVRQLAKYMDRSPELKALEANDEEEIPEGEVSTPAEVAPGEIAQPVGQKRIKSGDPYEDAARELAEIGVKPGAAPDA